MAAHAVPVLFDVGDARPATWRVAAAAFMLAVALWLSIGPVAAMIRVDPVAHSGRLTDRLLADRAERGPESNGPEVVAARDVLASAGVLDDAEQLWQPGLWLGHDAPAVALLVVAVALAAPRRLSGHGRIGLAIAEAVIWLVLVVPQVLYADTIRVATTITD